MTNLRVGGINQLETQGFLTEGSRGKRNIVMADQDRQMLSSLLGDTDFNHAKWDDAKVIACGEPFLSFSPICRACFFATS